MTVQKRGRCVNGARLDLKSRCAGTGKVASEEYPFSWLRLKRRNSFDYNLTQLRAIDSDPMQRDFCETRAGLGPAPLSNTQL